MDANNPPRHESLEARFHQNIKGLLSKTDQGRVMGAFRAALAGASDKNKPGCVKFEFNPEHTGHCDFCKYPREDHE